jgi:nicotinamide-nucleotide amidase
VRGIEVLTIGDEILDGVIPDTNATTIAQHLADLGLPVRAFASCRDDLKEILLFMREALARSDCLIVTGGLGPTQDDLTREAIAELLGASLVMDEGTAKRLEELFSQRGVPFPRTNLKQAMVPEGADLIEPVKGTAPGLAVWLGKKRLFALPGVPSEMEEMLERAVLPEISRMFGTKEPMLMASLSTWGLPESSLAEILGSVVSRAQSYEGLHIGFRPTFAKGTEVRILATPGSEGAEHFEETVANVRALLGDALVSFEGKGLAEVVGEMLCAKGLSLGVAESLTGGRLADACVSVPGASKWFKGGLVGYEADVKHAVLGVTASKVVSSECAEQMAEGVARLLSAEVGLATTGVAGPDALEGEAPGTVFLGAWLSGEPFSVRVMLPGDRERVRSLAAASALDFLRRLLMRL